MTHYKSLKTRKGSRSELPLYQRAVVSARRYVGKSTMEHEDKRAKLRRKAERLAVD